MGGDKSFVGAYLAYISTFSQDLRHFIFELQNFDTFYFVLLFLYTFWSGDRSPQALRAALADFTGCAGLCTEHVAELQAGHFAL